MATTAILEGIGRRLELDDVQYILKGDDLVFSMEGALPVVGNTRAAREAFERHGYTEGGVCSIESIVAASKPGEGGLLGYYINGRVPFEFFRMTGETEGKVEAKRRELSLPRLGKGMRTYPIEILSPAANH